MCTFLDLRTNNPEEIDNITPAMPARIIVIAKNRFIESMENEVRHPTDLIFRTK